MRLVNAVTAIHDTMSTGVQNANHCALATYPNWKWFSKRDQFIYNKRHAIEFISEPVKDTIGWHGVLKVPEMDKYLWVFCVLCWHPISVP
jgi:hypothetical protein